MNRPRTSGKSSGNLSAPTPARPSCYRQATVHAMAWILRVQPQAGDFDRMMDFTFDARESILASVPAEHLAGKREGQCASDAMEAAGGGVEGYAGLPAVDVRTSTAALL